MRRRITRSAEPMQPDPMFNEARAGPFKIATATVGVPLIVLLVLYGLSQPERQQTANAPATPPAANAPATAPSANAAASQPGANAPATTSQGATGNTGAGTTGQGTTNQAPNPQEQDPREQNTRP